MVMDVDDCVGAPSSNTENDPNLFIVPHPFVSLKELQGTFKSS